MKQAQQEVNDILSSIRQMISEEENITSPNSISSSDPKLSSEPVLDLTKMVQEDGSVVQLSATPQPSFSDLSQNEPLTSKVREQSSPMTFAEPEGFQSFYQEALLSSSSPYQAPAFEQAFSSETAPVTPMSNLNPSEEKLSQRQEKSAPVTSPEFLSQDTLQESAAAFAALAQATERQPSTANFTPTSETVGDYTVDALMRDLLKPLLKEWLDAHLPSLVRSLVLEQIEKVLQQKNKAGS